MHTPASLFVVQPSSGVPIYRQLVDQVTALVDGGRLAAGDTLPSVRDVAAALGINMMTVSKAYARLEADGVLCRIRGRGMAVAAGRRTAARRGVVVEPTLEAAVVRCLYAGFTAAEIIRMVRAVFASRSDVERETLR